MVWQDFIDISGDGKMLGCYECGTVFISKRTRLEDLAGKCEYLDALSQTASVVEKKEPMTEVFEFTAKCGKLCKSNAGRVSHERRCKKCAELMKNEI